MPHSVQLLYNRPNANKNVLKYYSKTDSDYRAVEGGALLCMLACPSATASLSFCSPLCAFRHPRRSCRRGSSPFHRSRTPPESVGTRPQVRPSNERARNSLTKSELCVVSCLRAEPAAALLPQRRADQCQPATDTTNTHSKRPICRLRSLASRRSLVANGAQLMVNKMTTTRW